MHFVQRHLWEIFNIGNNIYANRPVDLEGKVMFSLGFLTEYDGKKAYCGNRGIALYGFLTSALDGGEWSASHTGRFTSGEKAPVGWAGPTAGLDAVAKTKNSITAPCW